MHPCILQHFPLPRYVHAVYLANPDRWVEVLRILDVSHNQALELAGQARPLYRNPPLVPRMPIHATMMCSSSAWAAVQLSDTHESRQRDWPTPKLERLRNH